MRRIGICAVLVIFGGLSVLAKDQPFQVVSWPDSGQPVLRFTFSKFKDLGGGMGKERTYITDLQPIIFQTGPSLVRVFLCMYSIKVRQELVRATSI
jgi:hypothetical protein